MNPTAIDFLNPILGVIQFETSKELVYPTAMKRKILPARAWLMWSSVSKIGSRGERTVRVEKFRNQRLQKRRRKRMFMEPLYLRSTI
jgi:hypothetical protein